MRFFVLTLITIFSLVAAQNVVAQDAMPPLPGTAMEVDDAIRLSPDGPAVISLDEDASSVIIGNPAHASALLENPRLLMLVPGLPGATKVMALNRNGKAIFNRHVLVGAGKTGFKKVSRVCATSDSGVCAPVSMYYCPDKCYETAVTQTAGASGATGDISNPVTDTPENPTEDTVEQGISDGMSVMQ
ncbi:MAG: hypothetical protein EBQ96_00315 [Proteobacteria bacterium]|nr:hypothetical protein [Pseudomonadota bacterium]